MVDDTAGFAALLVSYAKVNDFGFEIGAQNDKVSMTLCDSKGRQRATLVVDGLL